LRGRAIRLQERLIAISFNLDVFELMGLDAFDGLLSYQYHVQDTAACTKHCLPLDNQMLTGVALHEKFPDLSYEGGVVFRPNQHKHCRCYLTCTNLRRVVLERLVRQIRKS
jgi:hypothetical protein